MVARAQGNRHFVHPRGATGAPLGHHRLGRLAKLPEESLSLLQSGNVESFGHGWLASRVEFLPDYRTRADLPANPSTRWPGARTYPGLFPVAAGKRQCRRLLRGIGEL